MEWSLQLHTALDVEVKILREKVAQNASIVLPTSIKKSRRVLAQNSLNAAIMHGRKLHNIHPVVTNPQECKRNASRQLDNPSVTVGVKRKQFESMSSFYPLESLESQNDATTSLLNHNNVQIIDAVPISDRREGLGISKFQIDPGLNSDGSTLSGLRITYDQITAQLQTKRNRVLRNKKRIISENISQDAFQSDSSLCGHELNNAIS